MISGSGSVEVSGVISGSGSISRSTSVSFLGRFPYLRAVVSVDPFLSAA